MLGVTRSRAEEQRCVSSAPIRSAEADDLQQEYRLLGMGTRLDDEWPDMQSNVLSDTDLQVSESL